MCDFVCVCKRVLVDVRQDASSLPPACSPCLCCKFRGGFRTLVCNAADLNEHQTRFQQAITKIQQQIKDASDGGYLGPCVCVRGSVLSQSTGTRGDTKMFSVQLVYLLCSCTARQSSVKKLEQQVSGLQSVLKSRQEGVDWLFS